MNTKEVLDQLSLANLNPEVTRNERAGIKWAHSIIRAAYSAGFIDDECNVLRVLGKLPITADGCVIPSFSELWFIDRHATKNADGDYFPAVARAMPTPTTAVDGNLTFRASHGMDVCWVSECYSTREAAEAAKKGKAQS